MVDMPIIQPITREEIKALALDAVREAAGDFVTSDEVHQQIVKEMALVETKLVDRFMEYRQRVDESVRAMDAYFRNSLDEFTRRNDALAASWNTAAAEIKGALSAYKDTEIERVEQVRVIRETVNNVHRDGDETRDEINRLKLQIFGDAEGGVHGMAATLLEIKNDIASVKNDVVAMKDEKRKEEERRQVRAEQWKFFSQSVGFIAKQPAVIKIILTMITGVLGSLGGLSLLAEAVRAISGGH